MSTELEDKILVKLSTALCVSCCGERPRIVMLWMAWFVRLKWRETGLEASLSFCFFNSAKMFAKAVCQFPAWLIYVDLA